MGHPNGERQKSEAMDQMIARRAEIAFQVKTLKIILNEIFQILEAWPGQRWGDHLGWVSDVLYGGQEDGSVLHQHRKS